MLKFGRLIDVDALEAGSDRSKEIEAEKTVKVFRYVYVHLYRHFPLVQLYSICFNMFKYIRACLNVFNFCLIVILSLKLYTIYVKTHIFVFTNI